ncbi:hypothetical protein GGQ91_003304 [Methylobacterium fujisawaense]|uniref:Uncharacterized protein n=1 Tax=Methylobacterium fujisawaense TaxID=107400 RepID=A0ABR6DDP1_9HYPH|nr:hypothetical protein [Methylobacterium fujisawaense]MBA9063903.1 hypothetical protein [Methylobacterium fujisawaense]
MLMEDAKREAVRRWRELPLSERRTDEQAAAFAMKLHHSGELRFRCSGDPYQHIKGWLQHAKATI